MLAGGLRDIGGWALNGYQRVEPYQVHARSTVPYCQCTHVVGVVDAGGGGNYSMMGRAGSVIVFQRKACGYVELGRLHRAIDLSE